MAKYQGIDDSCDSSALLGIIINIDEFPVAVRSKAEMIRSNIRNPWAHCNFQEWDKGKFATSFTEMGNFISSLDLKASVKQSTLDEITKWETNDTKFLKGTILGLELIKEIRQETSVLAKYAKVLKFILENEIEKRDATDKVIQDELMTLNEKIKDINQRQEEIIPKHIRDCHEDEIRGWEKDDETFVETRATEHVLTWISKCNIAVVTGSSGAGKSFLIHHVALELHRQKNYDIIPLSFVTAPSDIMKYYSKNKNQVFVIDDICGKGTMDVQLVNTWKDLTEKLNDIIKSDCTVTKLLISCRLQMFNDSQFKGLTRFTANVFDIVSEPLCLLPEERLLMIKKYLKSDKIDLVINDLCHFDFFPLLCKMSKNISFEKLPLFLKSPIDTIKQHIKHIIDSENKHQLCALILSILFDEGFKEDWLCSLKAVPEIITVKLKEITRHCDIDLKSDFVKRSLRNGFATLEGTFLKKNGTKYVIHDKIYDIAFIVCGQYLEECFIKYANEVLIGDLYIFRSIESNPTDEFIVLPEEMEERYFERLVDDLKQCDIYSTLHNNQLVHDSFRKKLISYLQQNAEDLKTIFCQIDRNWIKLLTREYHFSIGYDFDDKEVNVTYPLIEAAIEGYVDIVEFLLKMNCNVNKIDSFHRSALYKACEGGYDDVVKLLINHNADASLCHEDGYSPLHMACKAGNSYIVKLMLDKNADVNSVSRFGDTPLSLACEGGYGDIVQELLQNKAQVVGVPARKSSLCLACKTGNEDILNMLLAANTDIIYQDKYEWDGYVLSSCSPLIVACEKNHIKIIQLLFQKCSDKFSSFDKCSSLCTASYNGSTDIVNFFIKNTDISICEELDFSLNMPMFLACTGRNLETVQFFLSQGFDIFECNNAGQSLLHATCEIYHETEGHKSVTNLLIQKQLAVSKPDKRGLSPLHLACKNRLPSICKLLISNNANVNMQDNDNRTPLYFACESKNFDIVEILLKNKADIMLCDNAGRTPLHAICERCKYGTNLRPSAYPDMSVIRIHTESKSIVKSLIDIDAEVNSRDNAGESPLHKTCKYEDYELVNMLLSLKKSDINLPNNSGQTPLHLACKSGYGNIVKLLLMEKADSFKEDNQGKSPLHISSEILRIIKDNLSWYRLSDNYNLGYDDFNNDCSESMVSTTYNQFTYIVTLLTEYNADLSKS
ncbi:uncharacterized protein LOC127719309 [Mytilus californianus]|uniref:uncharacterized protein LOC127719309 n=1 Tax=Mytilus californianus TaxID=6549 RepID=UPI0022452F55|nr:uncharacterized protein LOC127719309 [Mytilus californianus]